MLWQVRTYKYGRGMPGEHWALAGRKIHRLYYIHSGSASITLPDKTTHLLPVGKLILLPESMDISISTTAHDPVDHTWFNFDVTPCFGFHKEWIMDPDSNPLIKKTLELLIEMAKPRLEGIRPTSEELLLVNTTLQNLLWLINEVQALPILNDTRIVETISYIQEHLEEPLSVELLADRLHLDKHYFIRLFSRLTGQPPHNYIRTKRLNYAAFLLQQGISVKEASRLCGYNDPCAFSRAFKSYYKTAPSDYLY